MRLFFATDIHGSETCWRKFLASGKHYGADAIVLGGDMTGKALVPILDEGGEAVERFEDMVRRRGYSPFRATPEELREYDDDPGRADRFFHEQMLATVERWMALADERLEDSGLRCFVCPGNDDQFDIDEVIAGSKHVELAEGRVVEIDGFQMASTGWSNVTPWKTYREAEEPQLGGRIDAGVSQVTAAPERTVFS